MVNRSEIKALATERAEQEIRSAIQSMNIDSYAMLEFFITEIVRQWHGGSITSDEAMLELSDFLSEDMLFEMLGRTCDICMKPFTAMQWEDHHGHDGCGFVVTHKDCCRYAAHDNIGTTYEDYDEMIKYVRPDERGAMNRADEYLTKKLGVK